ncbi:hypothetical protein JTB14_028736 [Gonioctena quinquepunctata]|nr:hypothetical protein JTB14_028736 [Gonioctena quinquepunctata]
MDILAFAHINARSLTAHYLEIEKIIKAESYELFGISESWLNDTISNEQVAVQGYNFIRNDRKSRGGGVCLYIKSNYKYSIIQISQSIEQLWIRLIIGNKSFAVAVIYNPPNLDQALFLDHFENTVSQIPPSNDTLICSGDFNTDLMKYDTRPAIDSSNVFEGVGLYQLIENPTRITDHTT